MNYQIFIDDFLVYKGNLYTLILIFALIFFVFWIIIRIIFHKLRSYENLKYEFITIIAHKFRTPLTQLKWMIGDMTSQETDSFKKENLNNMQVSNDKLIHLTNTLVELTDSKNRKLAVYNIERVNICELTDRVVKNLSGEFHKKNIFFGVQCSEPEIWAKVDSARMEFVIQTLVENSISYTESGKNVDVVVTRKGRKAIIQVNDNGIGIDPSELPRIFTKFYRSKSAQTMDTEGFGVNLFLAKSIVKRHKGQIEVNSEGLGKGSSFTIVLPRVK